MKRKKERKNDNNNEYNKSIFEELKKELDFKNHQLIEKDKQISNLTTALIKEQENVSESHKLQLGIQQNMDLLPTKNNNMDSDVIIDKEQKKKNGFWSNLFKI